jgi:sporulation protein YlmC with PRC-barrel domain
MRRRLVRVGLGAAAVSVAAAIALALLAAPHGRTRSTTGNNETQSIAEGERQASPRPLVPAVALIGRPVYGGDGVEAGKIVSLLADTRTGRIRYAVVERRSNSTASQDEMVELPGAMLRLPAAGRDGQDDSVRLSAVDEAASEERTPASAQGAVERELEKVDAGRQRVAPIQDLRGATVQTPSGETLGQIENVVVEGSPEPRIAYVTVRPASGDRRNVIVLPFAACAWRPTESSVLVVADPGTLNAAPVLPAPGPAPLLDSAKVSELRRAFGF